jgi:cytochrome c553
MVLLCAGCHGMSGEGRPDAGYPRLAGQPHRYLERQLEAYADGRRKSAVMEPLASSLTADERQRLAAHFASRDALAPPSAKSYSKRGETLAVHGDNALRVQACQNCHGPLGRGQAPYGPALAGMGADYLRAEMAAWKSGARRTDPSGAMPLIARLLAGPDVEAVAAYYAGLPVTQTRATPLPRYERAQPPTLPGAGKKPDKGKDAGAQGEASQGPASNPRK